MPYDDFSRFYDRLTDNVEYEKRADYFCRLLSMCGLTEGILLDLGCGTGSMSVEMAKKGFDVIGVDSSIGMLNAARQKTFESGITEMQSYLDKVNMAYTTIGNRSLRLTLIENRLGNQQTAFETLTSENEDADIADLAVQLSSAELTYDAALAATGKLLQTSLMNYI